MPSVLVQLPDMGLNSLVPQNMRDPREAGDRAQNINYENGILRTPDGFAKIDLTTTGLNSGDTILAVFPFNEIDNYGHLIAVTTNTIQEHDQVNSTWSDISQSGKVYSSNISNPISYAVLGHTDGIGRDGGATYDYFHLIVCDGGLTDIQRWSGRYESQFYDLLGGGPTASSQGYHDGTTHRALQVGTFKSRLFLISPREYNSATSTWVENNQRVRWPAVARLEDNVHDSGDLAAWFSGSTGSGYVDLIESGGTNVWSAPLGDGQYIIYQTNSIWSLNYVGGTDIIAPVISVPDLGLLASHLLLSWGNAHYFVGTDYNIYAYFGGGSKQRIGDNIHKYFQDDLDPSYEARCWMGMGPEGKRLWLFIVPSGDTYITKAYGMDLRTGKWMVRDFKHKWSTGGVTAVNLVGTQTYTIGDSYQEELNAISIYDDTIGDATVRYADYLLDTSRALSTANLGVDLSSCTWETGGMSICAAGGTFNTCFTKGDIIGLFDPSTTGLPDDHHFWTVEDATTNWFRIAPAEYTATGGGVYRGLADTSATALNTADMTFKNAGGDYTTNIGFFSFCGETYRNEVENIQVQPRLVIGDSDGFVYKFDATYTDYADTIIIARHPTPVFDIPSPDAMKRWRKVSYVAKELNSGSGAIIARYRIGNFDTSDTGWTDFSQTLTSEWEEYEFYINQSSKQLQCEFRDHSGSDFQVRSYEIFGDYGEDR